MKRKRASNLKIKDIEPFEHIEDVIKNTTPYKRYQWLGLAWNLWYSVRKTLPKRIIELQDKLRLEKI